MIEINVTPPELRTKKKKGVFLAGIKIPIEVVIGSIGGLFVILILVHISLLVINVSKLAQRKALQKTWDEIKPQKDEVDVVINEMRRLKKNYEDVQQLMSKSKFSWSQKLNIVSDELPRGVWLKRVALNEDVFFLEGSAISKMKKEMINVHNFTASLKNNKDFLNDLEDLELGSIQRRRIQKVEIADFLITTKVKTDE